MVRPWRAYVLTGCVHTDDGQLWGASSEKLSDAGSDLVAAQVVHGLARDWVHWLRGGSWFDGEDDFIRPSVSQYDVMEKRTATSCKGRPGRLGRVPSLFSRSRPFSAG